MTAATLTTMKTNLSRSLRQFLGLSLGRAAEYLTLSKLLKEYREVYTPEEDINGVDLIVRTKSSPQIALTVYAEESKNKENAEEIRTFINDILTVTPDYPNQSTVNAAKNFEFQELQIKSVSEGGLFAGITIKPRYNYWFIFYCWKDERMWLINSMDIVNAAKNNIGHAKGDPYYIYASQNTKGLNINKWSIDLTPTIKNPIKSEAYVITDFKRLP